MKHTFALVILVACFVACAPMPTLAPTSAPTETLAASTPTVATTPIVASTATVAPTIQVAPTETRAASTPAGTAGATATVNPNCATANTLEELGTCITAKMPRRDSNGYSAPAGAIQQAAFQIAARMLTEKCDAIALPDNLKNVYSISPFKDKQNGADYCVLMETLDENRNGYVDRGWGTLIINPKPSRELSIQVPHALFDIGTETQGIGVFKAVGARSYLQAGSHRDANPARSTCVVESKEGEADPAHNDTSLFFVATKALADFYNAQGKDWTAIQFHGMGASSCPGVDAFFSSGVAATPKAGDKILDLRANIQKRQPAWVVTVYGDQPSCNLLATQNVQGRLLNNVPAGQVCTVPAASSTGKFIHIEQKTNSRAAIADWIAAISETWK